MREDTVVQLRQPGAFSEDALTEILRLGARRLLGQAVEMEVTAFVEMHADLTDEAGRRRIVRHGHLPERAIQSIFPASIIRDRRGLVNDTSSILRALCRALDGDVSGGVESHGTGSDDR